MRWFRGETREMDRSPQFRCCFGVCHVKSGTIALGIYNLVTQLLALVVLTYAICHPEILLDRPTSGGITSENTDVKGFNVDFPTMPTPMALIRVSDDPNDLTYSIEKSDLLLYTRRKIDSGDAHVALALVLGLTMLTGMLLYGVMKERPLYLLPFFCVQVFDFIISCLTAVGHYSWLPSVHEMVSNNSDVPFRSELMKLNSQWVALSILLLYVIVLMVKAYFLGVVWACYQYLQAKRNTILRYTSSEDGILVEGSEAYLPPDYETAVKMPVASTTGPVQQAPPNYAP